ncbi:MAG TPA: alpha/beta hydrolase [Anaerolineaceae bacterium]
MSNFQDGFVQANGIRIHYYRSTPPAGGPTLLLLHGLTGNGMTWVRVAHALRAQYDLVMPDARGHGLSDKPPSGYAVEDRAADVAGLIDALFLDRPVIIGHSMGGETAMATAAFYPAKVGGVILEDPAWFNTFETSVSIVDNETMRWWRDGLVRDQSLERDALIANNRREHPRWHRDEIAASADARHQMSVDALVKILGSLHGGWRDWVRMADCPILLITGDPKQGVIITPEMAQECASLWKMGQEVHIPGAGHNIHRDRFGVYLQRVKAFLAGKQEGSGQ